MDDTGTRLATLGAAGSALFVVAVLLPFVTLPAWTSTALGVYYTAGLVGGWGLVLFASVAAIAFASAARGRAPRDLVAGVTLVIGVALVFLTLQWALSVPSEAVAGMAAADWVRDHRWYVLVLSLVIPVTSAWYGRAIGVLDSKGV